MQLRPHAAILRMYVYQKLTFHFKRFNVFTPLSTHYFFSKRFIVTFPLFPSIQHQRSIKLLQSFKISERATKIFVEENKTDFPRNAPCSIITNLYTTDSIVPNTTCHKNSVSSDLSSILSARKMRKREKQQQTNQFGRRWLHSLALQVLFGILNFASLCS